MTEVPEYFKKLVPPGFRLAPGEALDTCPYNLSHYCLSHKSGRHAEKCRKAYMKKYGTEDQDVELIACRYTDLHWIPAIELAWHQDRCPYKDFPQKPTTGDLLKQVPRSDRMTLNDLSVPQLERMLKDNTFNGTGEDWHVEGILYEKTHYPYNPLHALIDVGAPWCPPGLNKSERKEFREVHRDIANVKRGGTYFPPTPKWIPPENPHPLDYLKLK